MSNSGAFTYWQRTVVHSGRGSILRLPALFEQLGARRVMILSDAGIKAAGIVDSVLSVFAEDARNGRSSIAGVFCDVAPDAEIGSINTALAATRGVAADAILALGGGSVMDCAKMVKYGLHKGSTDILSLLKAPIAMIGWPEQGPMGIAHIAVPTTAGTGSEVTNGAVVLNPKTGVKHLLVSPFLESDMAVLDPGVTMGLPAMLTAATGLDALTHALEIVAVPNANDFALAHALYASQSIVENLPRAVADGRDVDARQAMLNASAMACNAVANNLGAAPVHNFAHAFGARYHIHHGEANGVFLPILIEQLPEYYSLTAPRLARAVGVDAKGTPSAVLARVVERIRQVMRDCRHPLDFARHKIPSSDVEPIVMTVMHDPLAGLYPLAPERIATIAKAACAWN